MKNTTKSRLMLVLSMVIFGTIGIFRRFIPIGSATLAMVRGWVGTLFLLAVMALGNKKIGFGDIRRNACWLVPSGIMIGINWILLFESYNRTSVAVATLCYYMAPMLVILASPLLFGEKLTARKGISAAIAFVGMILVSGVGGSQTGGISGVLFGLAAAVFYAGVVLINKKIHGISAYDKTIVQLGAAAIVLLPYVLLTEKTNFAAMDPLALGMLLFVGVIHTGVAYALYFDAIEKLPAQVAALYSYIDPIVAVILSAVLLSEKMGISGMVGTVCILGGTILSDLPEKTERNNTNL